jgi:hypothetical protein
LLLAKLKWGERTSRWCRSAPIRRQQDRGIRVARRAALPKRRRRSALKDIGTEEHQRRSPR